MPADLGKAGKRRGKELIYNKMSNHKFILLLFSLLLLSTCKKDATDILGIQDSLQIIHQNTSMVHTLDTKSILDKLNLEEVKQLGIYRKMLTQLHPVVKTILDAPNKSGVDIEQKIYVANYINLKNQKEIFNYGAFSIKDLAVFENIIKQSQLGQIQEKKGYKIIEIDKLQVLAWNKEYGLFGGSINPLNKEIIVAEIFNPDANKIGNNESLQKNLLENHDINSWFNSNILVKNPDAEMAMGLANIKLSALKNNYINSFIDFENGLLKGIADFDIQEGLTKELDLLFKDKISEEFLPLIPSENLIFLMSSAINSEGILKLLNSRSQAKSFANFSLRPYNLSVDIISNCLDGELVLAAYSQPNSKLYKGLFVTKIKDVNQFKSILNSGVESGLLNKTVDNFYQLKNSSKRPFHLYGNIRFRGTGKLLLKDNMLYISGDEDLLEKVETGNFEANTSHKSSFNQIFSLFTELNAIQDVQQDSKLQFSINRSNANFNLDFEDKSVNSLRQLIDLLNQQ